MTIALRSAIRTSVVLKILMAATGVVWIGFLVLHLQSNLRIFLGPENVNTYYAGLKSNFALLWGVRAILLVSIFVHVVTAFLLIKTNRDARGRVRYRAVRYEDSSYASRTMQWTGPILLAYIVYHLLHLTAGAAMPAGLSHDERDVYSNIVESFKVWYVALAYLIANGALGMHVYHGLWSAFRSAGAVHPQVTPYTKPLAAFITVLFVGGYWSMPIAVWLGIIQ